jgi:hypothetical protein
MKKILVPILVLSSFLLLLQGCAMFSAWKTIPPPGGCDQCHAVPINYNWQLVYKAPILNDERNRLSFQTEQGTMPQQAKPASSLDVRKMEEQQCFDCHRLPNSKHRGRMGNFHHQSR